MRLVLHLPRDPGTVPATRHTVDCALDALGVSDDCREDVALALSEVCANVVRHAEDTVDYTVMVTATATACTIDVHNSAEAPAQARSNGRVGSNGSAGSNGRARSDGRAPRPGPLSESGRGLNIVRAVMDVVTVVGGPSGLAIHMVKRLIFGRRGHPYR